MATPERPAPSGSLLERLASVVANTIPFASRLMPTTPAATPGTASKTRVPRSSGRGVRFMDPPVQVPAVVARSLPRVPARCVAGAGAAAVLFGIVFTAERGLVRVGDGAGCGCWLRREGLANVCLCVAHCAGSSSCLRCGLTQPHSAIVGLYFC